MKVLIINQWATNKGDRAVCYFLLKAMADHGIREVVVSTHDPICWQRYPDFPKDIGVRFVPTAWQILPRYNGGIPGKILHRMNHVVAKHIAFPLVRGSLLKDRMPRYMSLLCNREYYKAVKEADVVISTGGHRITTINTPDAVGPQIYDLAVATLLSKPPVIWSQSIGPFSFASAQNRELVRKLLECSPGIYVRNAASVDEIRKLQVSLEQVSKTNESVLGLYADNPERHAPSKRDKCIGVSIYPTNKKRPMAYRAYVDTMAGLVNHAIARGYQIVFFPMELKGGDRKCIADIINSVSNPQACSVEGFPPTLEHIQKISRCQAFVGHKTHSVVFSLVGLTPLVAIAYHMKTHDFMKECELGEYCISDAEFGGGRVGFDVDGLTKLLDRVIREGDEIYAKQSLIIPRLATKVQGDFASLVEKAERSLNKG